jgi:hypothetical protein
MGNGIGLSDDRRSIAGTELTDEQKAQLVVDLRQAADKLEDQLPGYN